MVSKSFTKNKLKLLGDTRKKCFRTIRKSKNNSPTLNLGTLVELYSVGKTPKFEPQLKIGPRQIRPRPKYKKQK